MIVYIHGAIGLESAVSFLKKTISPRCKPLPLCNFSQKIAFWGCLSLPRSRKIYRSKALPVAVPAIVQWKLSPACLLRRLHRNSKVSWFHISVIFINVYQKPKNVGVHPSLNFVSLKRYSVEIVCGFGSLVIPAVNFGSPIFTRGTTAGVLLQLGSTEILLVRVSSWSVTSWCFLLH